MITSTSEGYREPTGAMSKRPRPGAAGVFLLLVALAYTGCTKLVPSWMKGPTSSAATSAETLPQATKASVPGPPSTGSNVVAAAPTGSTEARAGSALEDETPAVDGSLDPSVVSKEMRARSGAIRACYERSLKGSSKLSGKVKLGWTITADGSVAQVEIKEDSLGNGSVAACIKTLVAHWRFPAPPAGPAHVVYPFVFPPSK
jgi:hypothetical protein